jgi:hypothetical protein
MTRLLAIWYSLRAAWALYRDFRRWDKELEAEYRHRRALREAGERVAGRLR